ATVSPATLTFTSTDYSTAQTVTVTPVQDTDGLDESVTITVSRYRRRIGDHHSDRRWRGLR
ncbi:MAG: hypothetical protein ISN28_13500, partial [Ectothiorhodospiraceae bacterium AqS1]|nr:hypothetical protein [Ectothiorhodospiraceae bacterium AqS1]